MSDSPPGQKIGRTMLTLCWVIVLIGLAFFFKDKTDDMYNPNNTIVGQQDDRVTEIVLKRNRFNHYVATGTINGEAVTFLLDTGATHVAVPAHLGNKLNLQKGMKSTVRTANGLVDVWQTRIATLDLGPMRVYDVRASLNPGMRDNEVLLGMSVLKDLEFTQRGDTLTIRQYK